MALPGSSINDEAAVVQVLTDYYTAFSTLEAQAVLPYFHEPTMLIAPQGVFAASTRALLPTAFKPTMDGLGAREYARSELKVQNVKSLSATATLVTGVAIRYKLDGQELDRAGVTYVLHKADARWKIAVLILHDPAEVARHE
ncbi:MAG: nuclear transport factor 2 family protein [Bryobacteraceae bacterium]